MLRWTNIFKLDLRPTQLTVSGQDLLTADGVAVKLSVIAEYAVIDPVRALQSTQNTYAAVYAELQKAIRQIVTVSTIDEVIEQRPTYAQRLMAIAAAPVAALGFELQSADVKDIILSGDFKKAMGQLAIARKQGLVSLEKARGETAALRHLANTARMLDDNPNLMQLRLVQTLGESTGNTIVFGALTPTPVVKPAPAKPPLSEDQS